MPIKQWKRAMQFVIFFAGGVPIGWLSMSFTHLCRDFIEFAQRERQMHTRVSGAIHHFRFASIGIIARKIKQDFTLNTAMYRD